MDPKTRKNRRKTLRIFIALTALMLAALAVLISPLFEIGTVYVEGNRVLTDEEIIAAAQIAAGQNIFAFSAGNAAGRAKALPFVREASVTRNFPDAVTITVAERLALANIRLANSATYIIIDDTGMVLNAGAAQGGLPVVTGAAVSHFAVGEYLTPENEIVFDDILSLSRIFRRYDFYPDLVDMSDPFDIVLQKGGLNILFGNIQDADRKVQYLQAITEQFSAPADGYLYIRDLNARPRFVRIR